MPQRDRLDTAHRNHTALRSLLAAASRILRSLAGPRVRRDGAVGPLAAALLVTLVVLAPPRDARAQCDFPEALLAMIPNPAPAASDVFGSSVAISGNVTVVGAREDDALATDAGTAYILDATTGALVATLNNPAPTLSDWFGHSVAISGNAAVVGATGDDAGATEAGRAYVFDATTGVLVTTLNNPAPTAFDRFGGSVAISGNVAVVGTQFDDAGATDAGRAYVFDATTGALSRTLANPAPAASDWFGGSVAISGNLVVIGAYADDAGVVNAAGAAYVFDATTGSLVTTLSNPAPADNDQFGVSVGISGNVAVVGSMYDNAGSGTAYVFNATTGALVATLSNPAPAVFDYFGVSVAVSGNFAVVGAFQDDTVATDAGRAYVFDATTGGLVATLTDPAPTATDWFGNSVAVSGSVAVVGARYDDTGATDTGSAYTFTCAFLAPSPTVSPSPTPPATPSPSPTRSPSASPSPSPSPSRSPSPSPTGTPSPSPTNTPIGPGVPCFNSLMATISNPVPATDDIFGNAVAISGNSIIVGAAYDNAGAGDAGTAYVFNATTGALVATLSNPAPSVQDYFGFSVALSGTVAVVGAYWDDAGAANAGRAYVFDATSGALVATLNNPAPASNDEFGWSVAVSGSSVVVGAVQDDAGAIDSGTAYVFNALTGALVTTLNNPLPASGDQFGSSVAISGSTVVVGAYTDDAGATNAGTAYVFNAATGALVTTLNNQAPVANSSGFGWSVAVSGSMALVGARWDDAGATDTGAAYVFDATTGALVSVLLNPAPAASDDFGFSVAISGNSAVVGARADDAGAITAGTAYAFDATTGALAATLSDPAPAAGDSFGYSVGVSGNVAVVGAQGDDAGAINAGSAFTFSCATPTPSPTRSPSPSPSPSPTAVPLPCFPDTLLRTIPNPLPSVYDEFGLSVAASGNVVVVGAKLEDAGATDAGRAYVFDSTTGALLATLSNPAPAANDWFGNSVSVSGNVAVVGASMDDAGVGDAGSAYVFNASTGAMVATLSNPAPWVSDLFGGSVAVSGNVAVVGASGDDAWGAEAGAAYVFDATTGALVATLNHPAPSSFDRFGGSVAISGNVAVVGAYLDDAGANGAGRAYVFNATTGALMATLGNPTPAVSDWFGFSVAVSGNLAVVGAFFGDTGSPDAGAAFVFDATTGALFTTLNNPAPTAYAFGVSVAVSGNVAVVGASLDDAGAADAGRAYVFDATTGALVTTLSNPTPAGGDLFGVSVAVSGNVAVVGSDGDDAGATDAGSAYSFSCTPGTPTSTPTLSPSPTSPSPSPTMIGSPTPSPTPNAVAYWARYE